MLRRASIVLLLAACRDESRPPSAAVVDIDPRTAKDLPPIGAPRTLDPDEIADARDGEHYRWTELAGRRWLSENARYAAGGSWCAGDDPDDCKKYGRLYEWDAAMTACPRGWHLPSEEEWAMLESIHPVSDLGFPLAGWRDESGESKDRGKHFYFWTSTEYEDDKSRARIRWNLSEDNLQIATDKKTHAYSVRCISDY
jgi:hypothetical protein